MQSQIANSQSTAELSPEIPVRNLVVDYLLKLCKWCGEEIVDSATKPRKFCNNDNVCCNNSSRHGGITKTEWNQKRLAHTTRRTSNGQYVTVMQRVDVGAKTSTFAHKEGVATKSVVKPVLVWVDGQADGGCFVADAVMVPQRPEPQPGPTHHTIDVNDRPAVPEPTPTITGWEQGKVEHKARRKTGRLGV
jgi:hypothetical protein